MSALVKIDGWPIRAWGVVGDLEDTTRWGIGSYSGSVALSCSWSAPVRFAAPWLRHGARFEIVESGVTVAEGTLTEIVPGEPWTIHAEGFGEALEREPVVEGSTVVTQADVENRRTSPWFVGTGGAVDPPAAWSRPWFVRPGGATLGPDASKLITAVSVFYVDSVDGGGDPDGWALTTPSEAEDTLDEALEAKFGPRRQTVDATALGLMIPGDADDLAAERFAAGGRRLGWSGSVNLTYGMLRAASGALAVPTSVHAGDTLTIPGFSDGGTQVAYNAGVTVTLGEVTRYWSEQRAVVKPVGASDRDLAAIFASIPRPADEAGVVVL